jgi:Tfp pilus assembly protein PilZ
MAKSKKRSLAAKKAWAAKRKAPTIAEGIGAAYQLAEVGSTMDEMEDAIDELIMRINAQTQRIKDMM